MRFGVFPGFCINTDSHWVFVCVGVDVESLFSIQILYTVDLSVRSIKIAAR